MQYDEDFTYDANDDDAAAEIEVRSFSRVFV